MSLYWTEANISYNPYWINQVNQFLNYAGFFLVCLKQQARSIRGNKGLVEVETTTPSTASFILPFVL